MKISARHILFTAALLALGQLPAAGPAAATELQVADAAAAAIDAPRDYTITDNYGDPSRFVKYIIRRPTVLA